MAFVSGGGGGGLPPQAPQPSAGTQLPGINSQLLETLFLQQQQQQQQQQQANNQGNVVALLAQALLGQNGNQLGALGAQALAPQQPAQNLILQQLQSQLALSSLLGQNTAALTSPLLTSGALNNPTLALYYAQLLQQQQQQQTSSLNLIQQLQQAQQAQPQAVQPAPPAPAPIPTQASLTQQIQAQVAHSAFQPPTAQAVSSSGNVESQLNAQQKLMDLINQEQQAAAQKEMEQRLLAAQAASTTASTSIPQPDRTVPRNTKEVHDRIDKLISENAAILQPQEPLLKRRPYHRAVGQQSSMDDSNSSSTRTSPGLPGQRDPRMLANNNRTQSLYEPINGIRAFGGGSLTSGQPVVRTQLHQSQHHTPTCPYCNVPFPNEAGLQCHELRCSKRIEMEKAKEQAASEIPLLQEATKQHPLKRRLLAAAMQDDLPSPSQKLARKDSGDIIVVTDRPQDGFLRKDSLVPVNTANNMISFDQVFGHPGLPRRATIAAIPTIAVAAQPQAPAPLAIPQPQAPPQVLQVQSQIPGPSSLQPSAMISPTQHPTAFHQVIQGQNRVNAATLSALQQQQLAQQVQQQVYQLQQAQQIPSTSAVHPPQPVIQIQKMEEDSPHQPFNINRLFPLDGNTSKPYTLVLNDAKVSSPEKTNRTRNRNITSETFVCLQRAQPMFVEQKGNLSMYSNWHQVTVNDNDAKLNLAFMAQCSAKPKTGHYPYWKYTVANRDMVQYKVTHSSFWEISQRQQLRLKQQQEMPEIKEEEPEIKQEEKENIDIPPLPPIPPMPQKSDLMPSPSFPESAPVSKDLSKTDSTSLNSRKDDDGFEWKPNRSPRPSKKAEPLIGGHRTDELYVYVRGRGRGRYVCDRCGIRCKKPSMLKKHIKSHTDIRPYKCKQCNFSFKTKGNLTKHLSSKTHKRRIQAGEGDSDGEDDGRLEIAEIDEEDKDEMVEVPDRLDEDEESEDEEAPLPADLEEKPFRRFGQENILLERGAHTPPSRWVLEKEDEEEICSWPEATWHRSCMSAPPVAVAGPLVSDTKKTAGTPSTPPLPITAMQFVQMENSLTATASPILSSNGLLAPQARLNGSVAGGSGAYMMNFFPKEEALKCDLCDKTFRKACDLNYHQLTHNVEKQQMINKNRMFQCPECRIPARTKAMLSKHMEQAHGSHIDESAMAAIDPSATTQSVLGGGVSSQMVNNPRSFMCLDCNIGFRKHGILAKHLRSKTHVTKLETLKRLPEDSLSLIQGHDNGACLNEVDTTDCEKARQSLTAIVENIRTKRQEALSSTGSTPATSSSAISLECRETLAASPMPLNKSLLQDSPSNGILRSSYSETSSPFRSRCGSAASSSTDIPRKRSDSLMNKIDQTTLQAMKFISANVWVPPKAQDSSHHRPESIALRAPAPSIMSEAMEVDNSSCPSPVMRILAANGHKSPPIPPGTRCSVCQGNFDTPVDLQVHLYTDHISVKDGTFFRCPRKLCEKVYPNKESLRLHVTAHYKLESLEKGIEHEEIVSNGACPSVRQEEHEASTPMTDGSDSSCHSPPTEPIRPIAVEPVLTGIPCMTCGKSFPDLNTLQQHWLSHVTNRGHVCQVCDAGFTTQEQLVLHQATHLNQSTNGVI